MKQESRQQPGEKVRLRHVLLPLGGCLLLAVLIVSPALPYGGPGAGLAAPSSLPDLVAATGSQVGSAPEGVTVVSKLGTAALAGETVCWSSLGAGDGNATGPAGAGVQQPGHLPSGGVFFHGPECAECSAGEPCSFVMRVLPPAGWLPSAHPRQRELRVVLGGPALALATATPLHPHDGSGFKISYQVWDAGTYRVSVRVPCKSLMWRTPEQGEKQPWWELATWQLHVKAAVNREAEMQPCLSSSLQGRWLLFPNLGYRWTPYGCSRDIPVENWIQELNAVGIQEISFIGDSHQQRLAIHLHTLLRAALTERRKDSGWRVDARGSGKWSPVEVYNFSHPSGARLRINSHFITGIFHASDAYGCVFEGWVRSHRETEKPYFPPISQTADVNIFDSGHWTGTFCQHKELAYSAYLPPFLLWLNTTVFGSESEPWTQERRLRRQRPPLMVMRSAPPFPTEKSGCSLMTNVFADYANAVARSQLPIFANASLFESVEVEGPRYADPCDKHHYSCPTSGYRAIGLVGEAVAMAVVPFLIREQRKRHRGWLLPEAPGAVAKEHPET